MFIFLAKVLLYLKNNYPKIMNYFRLALCLSIILFSCKKDCPPDIPIKRLPDFSIDSASKCIPVLYSITTNEFSFIEFFSADTLRYYKNSANSTLLFDRINILHDTAHAGCQNNYEYYGTEYQIENQSNIISYYLHPYVEMFIPLNFTIGIGPSGQFGCSSGFKICTENDLPDLDSVQILDKTFYDVYYRTSDLGCVSDMYYNKQYGVVVFNWQGEWYVLETDSL